MKWKMSAIGRYIDYSRNIRLMISQDNKRRVLLGEPASRYNADTVPSPSWSALDCRNSRKWWASRDFISTSEARGFRSSTAENEKTMTEAGKISILVGKRDFLAVLEESESPYSSRCFVVRFRTILASAARSFDVHWNILCEMLREAVEELWLQTQP